MWQSPPGNLHASGLVRLGPGDPPAPGLALVAGVAVEEAVREYIGQPFSPDRGDLCLKWPNDLLYDGAKLAGILLEREGDAVAVGIGVNLAHHPILEDRVTTSLAAIAGTAPEPGAFLETLATCFARWLAVWRAQGLAPIRARWLERAHPLGTRLRSDGMEGRFDGLEENGALRLRLADGSVHAIQAGDVFLVQD